MPKSLQHLVDKASLISKSKIKLFSFNLEGFIGFLSIKMLTMILDSCPRLFSIYISKTHVEKESLSKTRREKSFLMLMILTFIHWLYPQRFTSHWRKTNYIQICFITQWLWGSGSTCKSNQGTCVVIVWLLMEIKVAESFWHILLSLHQKELHLQSMGHGRLSRSRGEGYETWDIHDQPWGACF